VKYQIDDRFKVTAPVNPVKTLEVWAPIILESLYQRILDISVDAPGRYSITHDPEFGNPMLHMRTAMPIEADMEFRLQYLVERLCIKHVVDPVDERPIKGGAHFARLLAPETFVDVNDETLRLAGEIVGRETSVVERARKLYDYVIGKMDYDAAKQSWKGSTEHALVCSIGNCNDIHALFISLARSVGIPARLVLGQALEPPPPGQEACDLCGYHCWAEFFVPGLGWLPADASCACKYGTHGLFGNLEMNHVAWSVGRDIELSPRQQGGRRLFFAGPYVEVDGLPYDRVERHISFNGPH
jgi:transglutaminase-like putative cysteine protease